MAKRTQNQDYKSGSVTGDTILDGTVTIDDLKTQTDTNAITAETIPYERTSLTPTICDKIEALLSIGSTAYATDLFTGNGGSVDFPLSFTADLTTWHTVSVNGLVQTLGASADYTFTISNSNLHFNYTVENTLAIKIIYKKL